MATNSEIAQLSRGQQFVKSGFDSDLNDSSKTFTVPAGETWELLFAHVKFTSTATVGNRLVICEIKDAGGNVITDIVAGAVQAASNTYHYNFAQGVYRETSFTNGEMHTPIPQNIFMLPGWTMTFDDQNAVDAAADDMTVSYEVIKRDM